MFTKFSRFQPKRMLSDNRLNLKFSLECFHKFCAIVLTSHSEVQTYWDIYFHFVIHCFIWMKSIDWYFLWCTAVPLPQEGSSCFTLFIIAFPNLFHLQLFLQTNVEIYFSLLEWKVLLVFLSLNTNFYCPNQHWWINIEYWDNLDIFFGLEQTR